MKSIGLHGSKKNVATFIAIMEGLWNGAVVSAVLVVSAFLIKNFWLL
jgi:hypothetical protein